MDTNKWIVKNEEPELKTESFVDMVKRVIAEHSEWTEEDCQNWRDESDWQIKQAKRVRLGQFHPVDPVESWSNVDERYTH